MVNICCSKNMKKLEIYDFDRTKETESYFICIECGITKYTILESLDEEELLNILENNKLTNTLLYWKTKRPDEWDKIEYDLRKYGIICDETMEYFEDCNHINLTEFYGIDNTDKDRDKEIIKILKAIKYDYCGRCKKEINQIEIQEGVFGCPICKYDDNIVIY